MVTITPEVRVLPESGVWGVSSVIMLLVEAGEEDVNRRLAEVLVIIDIAADRTRMVNQVGVSVTVRGRWLPRTQRSPGPAREYAPIAPAPGTCQANTLCISLWMV